MTACIHKNIQSFHCWFFFQHMGKAQISCVHSVTVQCLEETTCLVKSVGAMWKKNTYESEIFSTALLCWFGAGLLCFRQLAVCIVTIPSQIQQKDVGLGGIIKGWASAFAHCILVLPAWCARLGSTAFLALIHLSLSLAHFLALSHSSSCCSSFGRSSERAQRMKRAQLSS